MTKKAYEIKKGIVVFGFIALLLTLISPTMPWVSTGYSIDGIIQLGRIEQVKYSESLTINFDLFGRGYGSYDVLVGDNLESTPFYAYMPELKTYGYANLAGSLIVSIGLAILAIYGFIDLPLIVALLGSGLVFIGGAINIGVSLMVLSTYMTMTFEINGRTLSMSEYYNYVIEKVSHVAPTLLGVPNFCGLGIGNFINLIGGLGVFLIGLYFLLNMLFIYLKPVKEEEIVGEIPE